MKGCHFLFCVIYSNLYIALKQWTWVVGFQMYMYFMCLTVFICSLSQYCIVSTQFVVSWGCVTAWLPHTVSVQDTVLSACESDPQLCGVLKMFVLVVTVVLSVSFCLSDGCEGQSLLAVSQNGLSLSLASLFSGICRLGRLHSYIQTVYPLRGSWWLHSKLRIFCLLIPPAKLVRTSTMPFTFFFVFV